MKFGNLGNIYYNIALYRSTQENCYENMVAVVSFAMVGINIYSQIKNMYSGDKSKCSGDTEVAGAFLMDLA